MVLFGNYRDNSSVFIIAEVGQNHQGDLEIAKKYISTFAREGADAIKFQTRNNKKLFSTDAYNSIYNSENAFGTTYGEHRERLELNPEWLPILKKVCHENGVKFMSTPFDEISLELLLENDVDILKIASFDLGNLPFINKIAKTGKPVALSIGGGNEVQIKASVLETKKYNSNLAILHCVSEYPCNYNKLGLENIRKLSLQYPDCGIGLSDHFNGTLSGPIAYLQGARVFEKHVTLNRAWKGTDHSFALEPEGFRKFVRDIKRAKDMLPVKEMSEIGIEPVFKKLGKSLVASTIIAKGDVFSVENLSGRIFKEQYIPVRESNKIIGRFAKKDFLAGDLIEYEFVSEHE